MNLQKRHFMNKKYGIKKVIQKKKEGDRVVLYVKWKCYQDKFNSYVFQDGKHSWFTLRYLARAA